MKTKRKCDRREFRVELSPSIAKRLKESSLGECTIAEEAVRMLRYVLLRMYPPRTPDEWRNVIGRDDWKELVQKAFRRSKTDTQNEIQIDEPAEAILQIPFDLMDQIDQIAHFKHITESEAVVYAIEYAHSEVFPPRTLEEMNKDFRATWRTILYSIWRRSK